ncbi:MAG: PQQ-binding-like beta-propeller repeat protein [Spirochaetales bacterium]|nr:PQQ-binding-like beta-propeller repeat protein [Spirochaetales bacterium]
MKKVWILLLFCSYPLLHADIVPLWDLTLGGKITTSPAVNGDNVYLVAEDRFLYSINAAGTLNWKLNIREWARDSLTIGPDGTIYVCTGFGNCLAVNKKGKLIWKFDLDDEPAGSPTIDFRGNIYIPTKGGKIFSISHTGRRKWILELPAPAAGAMTMDSDGTLYVATTDERIYAIDRFGEQRWVFLCAGIPGQVLPIADNLLVCGTDKNTIVALSKQGVFAWNVSFPAALHSVLLSKGKIFGIDRHGLLCCLDSQGNRIWSVMLNEFPSGGMLLGEVIHVFCRSGTCYTVSQCGDLLETFMASSEFSGSVLSNNGIIFAGNANWHVYAFNATLPDREGWIQRGLDSRHSSNLQGYSPSGIDTAIPDKFHTWTMREFSESADRELKFMVLDQIEQDYNSAAYFAWEDLYNELLYSLLSDGIVHQKRLQKRVINNFPDVRSRAADLMGVYGNLRTIRQLEAMLGQETDEVALRHIIHAVGELGSDPDGRIILQLDRMTDSLSKYNIPDKIVAEILDCLYKIGRYSANYEGVAALVVRLYSLDIAPSLKEDALQVLQSIRQ